MRIGIIGLGTFGTRLALDLAERGHEIIAVDRLEKRVEKVKNEATLAVVADATLPEAIAELDLAKLDLVIVAIGKNFETSVLVTARLRAAGKVRLWVRVVNEVHASLLELAGVERAIFVEDLASSQLLHLMDQENVLRRFSVDEKHALIEVEVPESFVGKTLEEVQLREKHKVNLVAIRKLVGSKDEEEPEYQCVESLPEPDREFLAGDLMLVYGPDRALRRFCGTEEA